MTATPKPVCLSPALQVACDAAFEAGRTAAPSLALPSLTDLPTFSERIAYRAGWMQGMKDRLPK